MSFTTRDFGLDHEDQVPFEDQPIRSVPAPGQPVDPVRPAPEPELPDDAPSGDDTGRREGFPPNGPSDVPTEDPLEAEIRRVSAVRAPLLLTGAALLTALTVTAVAASLAMNAFAQTRTTVPAATERGDQPGRGFEKAHPGPENPKGHEGPKARGADAAMNGYHTPPASGPGPWGTPTWVNRRMAGHRHHEEHPTRSAAEAKRWQDKRMWRQEGVWPGAKTWETARSGNWATERRSWQERGGYGGAFITQQEFAKHYTTGHDFRIGGEPAMKDGYAHFKHEGDRFVIVDPYPANWDTKWHKTDEVFLEYDQGYYLHNRKHPGMPLAVMVLE